ncbi:hypothetical protein C8Q73DRAFT_839981 [Cubamyces lactineus]|nr:hypothetical protein C8Q73DRAFT_839981 [Cubamyces lactineus]
MPSKNFAGLTAKLRRRHAALLIQFRTNHVPLQAYLMRIGKADSAACPTCGAAAETVAHFLLACPPSKEAIRPLFDYVHATGRLRSSFGSLDLPDEEDGDASNSGSDDEDG